MESIDSGGLSIHILSDVDVLRDLLILPAWAHVTDERGLTVGIALVNSHPVRMIVDEDEVDGEVSYRTLVEGERGRIVLDPGAHASRQFAVK